MWINAIRSMCAVALSVAALTGAEEPPEPRTILPSNDTPDTAMVVCEAVDERDAPNFCRYILTEDEIRLCMEITYHEAGAEPVELQRTVMEVLINRLQSGVWGSTMSEVIFARNHSGDYEFDTIYFIGTQPIPEITKEVVWDVLLNGTAIPDRIMFFRTDHYHKWDGAIDEFQIGNVYFSSSRWYQ